jgi:hypothetical protein
VVKSVTVVPGKCYTISDGDRPDDPTFIDMVDKDLLVTSKVWLHRDTIV